MPKLSFLKDPHLNAFKAKCVTTRQVSWTSLLFIKLLQTNATRNKIFRLVRVAGGHSCNFLSGICNKIFQMCLLTDKDNVRTAQH